MYLKKVNFKDVKNKEIIVLAWQTEDEICAQQVFVNDNRFFAWDVSSAEFSDEIELTKNECPSYYKFVNPKTPREVDWIEAAQALEDRLTVEYYCDSKQQWILHTSKHVFKDDRYRISIPVFDVGHYLYKNEKGDKIIIYKDKYERWYEAGNEYPLDIFAENIIRKIDIEKL